MSEINIKYINNLEFDFEPPLTPEQSKFVDDIINIGCKIKDQRTLMDYIAHSFDCIKRLDFEVD